MEQIDGRDLVERSRPTAAFDGAATRVSGHESCNRYSAGLTTASATFQIKQALTTKMACPGPVAAT